MAQQSHSHAAKRNSTCTPGDRRLFLTSVSIAEGGTKREKQMSIETAGEWMTKLGGSFPLEMCKDVKRNSGKMQHNRLLFLGK